MSLAPLAWNTRPLVHNRPAEATPRLEIAYTSFAAALLTDSPPGQAVQPIIPLGGELIHDFSAIARSAASRLGRTWRAVLTIHITCTLLAAVILVPLAGIIGRLLLELSGRTVATDQDILYFFLSPVGLLALVFVAVVLVAILALEQAALMAIAASAAHQRPLDLWTALRFAWSRAPGILRLASQVVVRCLLIALRSRGARS